ncbi:MAG: SDR family NAD(P)-dependent oxidoreductase [Spirochaeta sp.]
MKLMIISGGSRGLGAELCSLYRTDGWEVIEFSRSAPHDFSVEIDFRNPEATGQILQETISTVAKQNWDEVVAIGNAATLQPVRSLAAIGPHEIAASVQVNIGSALIFFAEILRGFSREAGRAPAGRLRLAQISSGAAHHGYAGWALYCSGKAAMVNAMRAIALEHIGSSIDVFSIDPGLIDTEMQQEIRNSSKADFPAVEKFIRRQKDGELKTPEDTAAAVYRICGLPEIEPGSIYKVQDFLS